MSRTAPAEQPIHPILTERWSPRAFADKPVPKDQLAQLFEAARWSASSYNEQPWRFIVAVKDGAPDGGADYAKALACLVEFNQQWAKTAPVLILTAVGETFLRNGKPNGCAEHDLGLAVGNLSAQATHLGLMLHQMAGIEPDKVRSTYNIPEGFHPMTAIAVGYLGDPERIPQPMRPMENMPRIRKPLSETVFSNAWGKAAEL